MPELVPRCADNERQPTREHEHRYASSYIDRSTTARWRVAPNRTEEQPPRQRSKAAKQNAERKPAQPFRRAHAGSNVPAVAVSATSTELKARVCRAVDAHASELEALAQHVFAMPELGFKEHR